MSSDVKSNAHRRYSPELKERAVRLVPVLRVGDGRLATKRHPQSNEGQLPQ